MRILSQILYLQNEKKYSMKDICKKYDIHYVEIDFELPQNVLERQRNLDDAERNDGRRWVY